jgi:hypothetical protein
MAAPLRITRPPVVKAAIRKGGPAPDKPTPIQGYMERLVKLIPAEVVGLYLVGQGIIPPNEKVAIVVWSIVCLGLVVLVRAKTTGDRVNSISPQWGAVAVSTISFIIWVYTMPGPFQAYHLAIPYLGALAVLVWTFIVPFLYQGS